MSSRNNANKPPKTQQPSDSQRALRFYAILVAACLVATIVPIVFAMLNMYQPSNGISAPIPCGHGQIYYPHSNTQYDCEIKVATTPSHIYAGQSVYLRVIYRDVADAISTPDGRTDTEEAIPPYVSVRLDDGAPSSRPWVTHKNDDEVAWYLGNLTSGTHIVHIVARPRFIELPPMQNNGKTWTMPFIPIMDRDLTNGTSYKTISLPPAETAIEVDVYQDPTGENVFFLTIAGLCIGAAAAFATLSLRQ